MNGLVYGLVSREQPERIRYVGWTQNAAARLEQHRNERGHRTKRDKWIWSMRERGIAIDMIVLQSHGTLEDEVRWIAELRPDLNGTPGGTGGRTIKPGTKLGHGDRIRAGQEQRKADGWTYPKVELTDELRHARGRRMRGLSPDEKAQVMAVAQPAALMPDARAKAVETLRRFLESLPADERKRRMQSTNAGYTKWAETVPRVSCVKCRATVRLPWWPQHSTSRRCVQLQRRMVQ